jgi:hypothetical protein
MAIGANAFSRLLARVAHSCRIILLPWISARRRVGRAGQVSLKPTAQTSRRITARRFNLRQTLLQRLRSLCQLLDDLLVGKTTLACPKRPSGLHDGNLTACWLMASAFVVGYPVGGMFHSYLQKDLGLPTGFVALPIMLQSLMFFLLAILWGWFADRFGRRLTLIITALMTIPVAPLYLLTTDYSMIVVFFTLQGFFGGGGMHTQWPHYLSKHFPTEVRATATGFCYHQGAPRPPWRGRLPG